MEISWLGHSCVRVRSSDVTLITDPYDESLGLSRGGQRADVVTISHLHPHHAHYEDIEGDPKVLQGPGDYEVAHFYINGMATDRNLSDGEPAINTIFTIKGEGLTLCHLGDLNMMPTPQQIQELSQTDILFVPAGGVCTIGAAEVAELVNLVDPRIVVPLHYRTEDVAVEVLPLDGFLQAMGVTEPTQEPKINVTATNLPRDLRLVVLKRVS